MDTNAGKKIFGLDFLRALAILLVFIWHYRRYGIPGWLEEICTFGWTGVDLFFVLSGYLIGGQLFKKVEEGEPLPVRDFYLKRFFRIIPAYLVVLAIYFCIPAFREREGISPLWKFLSFTMNFGLDYQEAGAFSNAWSLCIEEQFYLFFPLILLALTGSRAGKGGVWLLPVLLLLGIALRMYCWQTFVAPVYADQENMSLIANTYSRTVYYPTYNRLDGLLAGIAVALLFVFRPAASDRIKAKANLVFLAGIFILAAAWWLCRDPFSFSAAVWGYPVVAAGYACLVMAVLSPACFVNRLRLRLFPLLATLSYAIYLLHKPLNHLVHDFLEPYHLNGNLVFLSCLLASCLGAALLYLAVERPFLKLRGRLLGRGELSR